MDTNLTCALPKKAERISHIERAGVKGNLEIRCCAEHICGPVAWNNADIEICYEPDVGYVVLDRAAGVRIVTMGVDVAENVKPVFIGAAAPDEPGNDGAS